MLKKIISFEIGNRIKSPIFYFYILLMVLQVVILTKGIYDYYINDAVLINSSTVLYKDFTGGGMILIILIAIITGMVLYKDIEYKTAETIYTFPVNEKMFFVGKFLAAFLINLIITSGFVFGMFLLPYAGIGKPEDFGPPPLLQMAHGYFVLLVPNIFLLTAACFIPMVFTRKLYSSYLGILTITILFVIFEGVSHTSTNIELIEILDPISYVYVAEALDVIPTHAKNTAFLPLTTTYFINKGLWLSLAFIGLFLAYKRFSFSYFIEKKPGKLNSTQNTHNKNLASEIRTNVLPKVQLVYTQREYLAKFFRLAKLEFLNLVRPKSFKIVFGIILLLFLLQNFLFNASYYIGPEHPITTNMTQNRLILGVFIIILIMFWTGELIFKEKTTNLWQITDTLPIPVWVRLLSKYTAMAGVAFILGLAIVISGVITQLAYGFTNIEWSLYAEDVFGYKFGWLTYLSMMTLPFFVAGITGKRFLTHIVSIGFFIFTIIAFELNVIEDHRLGLLVGVPGLEDYSEIGGYGTYSSTSFWFFSMWGVIAIFFMLSAIYFWKRGNKQDWIKKLTLRGEQLNWGGKIASIGCLILFFVLQSFISKNIEDNYKTIAAEEAEQAAYETKYKYIEAYAQPIINTIDIAVDLYPKDRKIEYTTHYTLKNESNSSIDTLYINLSDYTTIQELSVNSTILSSHWEDQEHYIYAYPLSKTLLPNNEVQFYIKASKQYKGLSTIDPQTDITYNGSVINRDLFPQFGYNHKKELDENKKRRGVGLEKIQSKMNAVTDIKALNQNYFSKDAHKVTGKITVSTSIDQQPLSIGKIEKRWSDTNRNYVRHTIDTPTDFNINIASAAYVNTKVTYKDIDTYIWYKKTNGFNIDTYKKAIIDGLQFIEKNIGKPTYKEINIAEISYYNDPFYVNSNLILISEKDGWRADTSLKKEESYIHFSVITQLIKQQLFSKTEIANVQGAEMLTSALPQAIALQIIKQKFGKEIIANYLKQKKNTYEKNRGNEPNTEPPLLYADGSEYLEKNKGTYELYHLSTLLGVDTFNQITNDYIDRNSGSLLVFKNLYKELYKAVPNNQKDAIKSAFEEAGITIAKQSL
ncbi:ABC transporter permease [Aquimarina sp. I32.4]|uniref:ABC transporter permease n=1 Tax=Aquimarina sp. I32.4 TaxID=2053903 RepID=UPI0011AF15CD|nr:hypothetical protein [Aquimarina sp. I32.4]